MISQPSKVTVLPGPYIGKVAKEIVTYDTLDEIESENIVLIRHMAIEFSAGNGRENSRWGLVEKQPLPFQANFIRKLRAAPKDLVAVEVIGDSMEPLLLNGDTILIDESDKTPSNS